MTEDSGEVQDKASRTWYPYVTKVQFDKFLSRLERTIPEQIDRDYMRAIIRTPSMIHRFLRGIEAMNLIDRDQQPTDRLRRLVDQQSRNEAMVEVLQDLYPDLLGQWNEGNGQLSDNDIVSFFTERTGMGRDSANKMKMFFKYLITESGYGSQDEAADSPAADSPAADSPAAGSPAAGSPAAGSPAAGSPAAGSPAADSPSPEPARASGPNRGDGRHKRGQQQPGQQQPEQRHGGNERGADRGGQDRASFGRALTESQMAYLEAVQKIVRINVDGDWDEEMMRVAFDRLERLLDRIRRA